MKGVVARRCFWGCWSPVSARHAAKLRGSPSEGPSRRSPADSLVCCHSREAGCGSQRHRHGGQVCRRTPEPAPRTLPLKPLLRQSPLVRSSASKSHAQYVTLAVGAGALDSGANGHRISTSDIIDMPCRVTPTAKMSLRGREGWTAMTPEA